MGICISKPKDPEGDIGEAAATKTTLANATYTEPGTTGSSAAGTTELLPDATPPRAAVEAAPKARSTAATTEAAGSPRDREKVQAQAPKKSKATARKKSMVTTAPPSRQRSGLDSMQPPPPHRKVTQATAAGTLPKERLRGELVTIRLFLSSTFVDTHGERDAIVQKVLPALNKLLAARDVQVVPVDLRWGISAAESQSDTIQTTCLDEIDRCRVSSDEPAWFVGLRSARYGWVQDAFNSRDKFARQDTFGWLEAAWKEHESRGMSITSMEVWHALLGCERQSAVPHAFFAFRDDGFLKNVDPDWRWLFDFEYTADGSKLSDTVRLQYQESPNAKAFRKDLASVNSKIRGNKNAVCFDYTPSGDVKTRETGRLPSGKRFGTGSVGGLETFSRELLGMLYTAIDAEYPAYQTELDLPALHNVQHELMARERRQEFVGRMPELAACMQYIQGPATVPMLVGGPSGTGKSSFMAEVIRQAEQLEGVVIVKHFVGTNPDSFSWRKMLARVCRELSRHVIGGLRAYEPPETPSKLLSEFPRMLSYANKGRSGAQRCIVVLDGVNQLFDEDSASNMKWMPASLPSHIRVFVATADGSESSQAMKAHCPPPLMNSINPLTTDECKELVRRSLAVHHKALCENPDDALLGDQMSLLLAKEDACMPLYLLAVASELVKFGVYEQVTPFIKEIPQHFTALFEFVLERLEQEHGKELVTVVFRFIGLTAGGIMEAELSEILAHYDFQDVPVSDYSRLYQHIKVYVTKGGSGVLSVFYAQLNEVLEKRYYDADSKANVYRTLAEYYRAQAHGLGMWSSSSPRPFLQLPQHVLLSEGIEGLSRLLLDVRFLCRKVALCGIVELSNDMCLHPLAGPAATLGKAVEESLACIQRDANTLPYQLAGRLSGAAEPELQELCRVARTLCYGFSPLNGGGLSLTAKPAVMDTSSQSSDRAPAVGCLGTVGFKPDASLGTPSLVTLSKDGRFSLIVCMDQMIVLQLPALSKVLEVSLMQEMTVHGNYCSAGAFSPNGTRFCVAGGPFSTKPARIGIWETGSGNRLAVLEGHEKGVHAVTFHPDGTRVLSASLDGTCRIWDVEQGRELACFAGHGGKEITNVFCLGDTAVLTAGKDNRLLVWNMEGHDVIRSASGVFTTEAEITQYENNQAFLSPDGMTVVTYGCNFQPVRLYDVASLECKQQVKIESHSPGSVRMLSDGVRIASSDLYGPEVCIIDTSQPGEAVVQRLRGHAGTVKCMAATSNMCLITASDDAVAKSWGIAGAGQSAEVAEEAPSVCRQGSSIQVLAAPPDNGWFVSFGKESETGSGKVVRRWSEDGAVLSSVEAKDGQLAGLRGDPKFLCFLPGDQVAVFTDTEGAFTKTADMSAATTVVEVPKDTYLISAGVLDFAHEPVVFATSADKAMFFSTAGALVASPELHGGISAAAVSHDGAVAAASIDSQRLVVWNKAGKQVAEAPVDTDGIIGRLLPVDANTIVMTAFAKLQKVNVKERTLISSKTVDVGHALSVAVLSADAQFVITVGEPASVHIFRVADLTPVMSYKMDFAVEHLAITGSGRLLMGCAKPDGLIGIASLAAPAQGSPGPAWFTKVPSHERTVAEMTQGKGVARHISDHHTVTEYNVAFREAAFKGRIDLCQSLLGMGAQVDMPDAEWEMTALQLGKSTLPTVALGDDTVLGDAQFLTMLIVSTGVSAAMGGHTEACRWLVEKGASVAHESKQGDQIIRQAVMSDNPETVAFFLDHGVDLEWIPANASTKTTNLAWATSCMKLNVVEMLIKRGANLHAEVYAGRTVIEQVKSWKEHADLGVYGTEKTKSILKCIALVEAHEG